MAFKYQTKKFSCFMAVLLIVVWPLTVPAAQGYLLVFAAASLKNAMDGVVSAYAVDHAADVRVSYASSATLARQIQRGAPAQVYVSANQWWMDWLEKNGLILPATRVALLRNAMVLVAPAASNIKITSATDIVPALGGAPLAMANTDAVPAGIYGRQVLQHLGVWRSLHGRIAQAADVRAALMLVARGEAPLGIVYASDAVAVDGVRVVKRFDDDAHDPIVYPAAILAATNHPQAEPFLAFLQSKAAGDIFRKWGFMLAQRH